MTQIERLVKESPNGKDFEDVLDFAKNTQDVEELRNCLYEAIKVQVWMNDFVNYVHSRDHELYIESSEYSNQFIQLY